MVNYPPYVNCYSKIKDLMNKIKVAAVPPKFTQDFLYTKLGLKSTTHRQLIPLLKKLGFLTEGQVPTKVYQEYRDNSKSEFVMAKQVKLAYKDLFQANEYAYELTKPQISDKLSSVLGAQKNDKTLSKVVATLWELIQLSNFEGRPKVENKETSNESQISQSPLQLETQNNKIGISYTINLNLPATSDIEVFNSIFKSLKENLLK